MLIVKKIIIFSALILTYSLLGISFSTFAEEKVPVTQEQLISQIESLFLADVETLNYSEIVELGNKIVIQRGLYPSETLAKTYLLLANVAKNKGELETAFQFIQDGLAISTPHAKTNLDLQITLAGIHAAQNKSKALLKTAQQAIDMQEKKDNSLHFLIALSYRSVAFAMLAQYKKAVADLQNIASVIKKNPPFAEDIRLLAIIADTYFYLGDYQTALTVQLKVLELRFNLNKLGNVNQTYYHIANAYYHLHRFDDAYNAYWESKKYAEKKNAPIYVAYANQGLGLTLFHQKQYINAEVKIQAAKSLFYQHNLAKSYLETLVTLIQISQATEQDKNTISLVLEAERTIRNTTLNDNYIILYQILAQTYILDKDIDRAYFWQKQYSTALLKMNKSALIGYHLPPIDILNLDKLNSIDTKSQARQPINESAKQSTLITPLSTKNQQQDTLIFTLSIVTFLLLCAIVYLWLKNSTKKLTVTNEEIEIPANISTCPIQTKKRYQSNFNMAKQYSYPLTLGYISISNWQELAFQFNKKVVAEVTGEIAKLISKYISEFDNAGLLSEGEYLILFSHQEKANAELAMEKILSVLKLRFFANLGKFSLTINYSVESPSIDDTNADIFLSQLRNLTKIV